MKHNSIYKSIIIATVVASSFIQSCTKKLDLYPENTTTSEVTNQFNHRLRKKQRTIPTRMINKKENSDQTRH